MFIRLKEQQKEINELGMAYREERTRRKAIQRDLRREQEAKERLMMEVKGIWNLLIEKIKNYIKILKIIIFYK